MLSSGEKGQSVGHHEIPNEQSDGAQVRGNSIHAGELQVKSSAGAVGSVK